MAVRRRSATHDLTTGNVDNAPRPEQTGRQRRPLPDTTPPGQQTGPTAAMSVRQRVISPVHLSTL